MLPFFCEPCELARAALRLLIHSASKTQLCRHCEALPEESGHPCIGELMEAQRNLLDKHLSRIFDTKGLLYHCRKSAQTQCCICIEKVGSRGSLPSHASWDFL